MSDSDSDCDELFYYPGRKNIQEKCITQYKELLLDEEKLKEVLPPSSVTIEPIFASDEEGDRGKIDQAESDSSSLTNEATSKRSKFNAEEFIAAIDKKSKIKAMKEMKKHDSQSEATYHLGLIILCRKIKQDVKQLSKTLNKDRMRQEKRKKLIQSLKKKQINQTTYDETTSTNVWLLVGEEKERALRNDYEEQEDVVCLILRITHNEEERKEAINMNKVVSEMLIFHVESTANRYLKDSTRMRMQWSKSDV